MLLPVLLLAVSLQSVRADDAKKELRTLAGTWAARTSRPIPPGLAPEIDPRLPYIHLNLDGDGKARVNGPNNPAKITFHPDKTPKAVDFEYTDGPLKGKKQHGVYEFKKGKVRAEDTWVIVVGDIGVKEADRPKDLAKAGPKATRYVFHRSYSGTIE
jgi:uncharacterized protein (TIGR03067 family)